MTSFISNSILILIKLKVLNVRIFNYGQLAAVKCLTPSLSNRLIPKLIEAKHGQSALLRNLHPSFPIEH